MQRLVICERKQMKGKIMQVDFWQCFWIISGLFFWGIIFYTLIQIIIVKNKKSPPEMNAKEFEEWHEKTRRGEQ